MLNQQLLNLYSSYWDNYQRSLQDIINDSSFSIKPTNPYLIHVENENDWRKADIRLMVFGQETNSWFGTFENEISKTIGNYIKFVESGECWTYGKQYWNGVKRFESLLRAQFPNHSINSIYNNIVKTGKARDSNGQGGKGFPPDYIYDLELDLFPVITKEIDILKPNLILFLSGPNRDFVLDNSFKTPKKFHLPDFTYRQLIKIDLPGVEFAFRTYHPNYLWRNNLNRYFDSIIQELTF